MLKLILLTYENRSGSTLIAKNLNSDKVVCCPESDILMQIVLGSGKMSFDLLFNDYKFNEWHIRDALRDGILQDLNHEQTLFYLLSTYARKISPLAEFILIKGTDYLFIDSLALEKLQCVFKDVIMLRIRRDPVSIFNSQIKSIHSLMGTPMENNAVTFYKRIQRRLNHRVLVKRLINVQFEEYIVDINKGNSRILSELGLNTDVVKQLDYKIGKSQLHLHNRKFIDSTNSLRQSDNIGIVDFIVLKSLIIGRIKSSSKLLIPYKILRQIQWRLRILKKSLFLRS